jgi:hypothetical protein
MISMKAAAEEIGRRKKAIENGIGGEMANGEISGETAKAWRKRRGGEMKQRMKTSYRKIKLAKIISIRRNNKHQLSA